MRELSVAGQRYLAVLAVIADGLSVSQAAENTGVSRQTLHSSLARYEVSGLQGLVDVSHRPRSCPQAGSWARAQATRRQRAFLRDNWARFAESQRG